jgi:hypothetical protein
LIAGDIVSHLGDATREIFKLPDEEDEEDDA